MNYSLGFDKQSGSCIHLLKLIDSLTEKNALRKPVAKKSFEVE
jgi:hypothetical protein